MGINNTRNNCIKTSGQKVVSRKNINVKLLVSSIHSKSKTYIYDFTLIN